MDTSVKTKAATLREAPTRMPGESVELSLVVPCYNEEAVLDRLFARLEPVLEALGLSYEIICVNDGSRDGTLEGLLAHRERNQAIKILDLSRNFGKETALTAGLDACRGRAIIPLDADLQDPPELIPELIAKWREGYEVVFAERASRESDGPLKRLTAKLFYRTYNSLTNINIPANAGDFRLMDQRVVAELRRLPENNRFMKGLFAWVGFHQTGVGYVREPRAAGKTTWNYWRLWNFAIDGITSFSTAPLRVWSYVGLAVSLAAFIYAGILILRVIFVGVDVPGYASLMVVVLFLGGIQLITLGVIGEYLGRIFIEVKGRPIYIVNRSYGLDED
jgi:glycosyltransferase involved in cell wall biosynthesis